jgi:hypothetical protein
MRSTPRTTDHPAEGSLSAPPVRLEPCVAFVATDGGPCCADCGWAADDHEPVEQAAFARAS